MKLNLPHWISSSAFNSLKEVEGTLWVDRWPAPSELTEGIKILCLIEPRATYGWLYDNVAREGEIFDLILTFDELVLKERPNARLLYFGTSWISNPSSNPPKPGVGGSQISFLCGDKLVTKGQAIRRAIYTRQRGLELLTGKRLYVYRSSKGDRLPQISPRGNPIYKPESKDALHLPFQYSIVIENSNQSHYFSEKLLDAFLCGTIPIYWGSPCVATLFNPKGVVFLQGGKDEVLQQLETLLPTCNEARHKSSKEAIEENYERALLYAFNFPERLVKAVEDWLQARTAPSAAAPSPQPAQTSARE